MSFDGIRAVADAVLFEGYLLYPYRASAPKNKLRWTFGVLAPRTWAEAQIGERWWIESQLLIAPAGEPAIKGELRFLQVEERRIEVGGAPVLSLDAGGKLWVPSEEGVLHEIPLS